MLNPSSFKTTGPLADFSIRYGADVATNYVWDKLFPVVNVPNADGKFWSYSKDNLRSRDGTAPSGSEAKNIDWGGYYASFACKEKAFKALALGRDARDFDAPVADIKKDAAMSVMDALMIEAEATAYTKVTTSGNYPGALVSTLGATVTWALDAGNPVEDVRSSRQAVFDACGKYANAMACSRKTLEYLKIHPAIVDRVKYTSSDSVAQDVVARLLGLDAIFISDAVSNSAIEGAADSLGSIWADKAVLFIHNPTKGLRVMRSGVTFMAQNFYTKEIDAPHLGRSLGASYIESGWEYAMEFAATVSSSDTDTSAMALIANTY